MFKIGYECRETSVEFRSFTQVLEYRRFSCGLKSLYTDFPESEMAIQLMCWSKSLLFDLSKITLVLVDLKKTNTWSRDIVCSCFQGVSMAAFCSQVITLFREECPFSVSSLSDLSVCFSLPEIQCVRERKSKRVDVCSWLSTLFLVMTYCRPFLLPSGPPHTWQTSSHQFGVHFDRSFIQNLDLVGVFQTLFVSLGAIFWNKLYLARSFLVSPGLFLRTLHSVTEARGDYPYIQRLFTVDLAVTTPLGMYYLNFCLRIEKRVIVVCRDS